MNIDTLAFTPGMAAAGGVLIGLGSALLLVTNGRVAGISSVIGGLFKGDFADYPWRLAFLAGLVMAPSLYAAFVYLPGVVIDNGYASLIVAGLLVGVGTRWGNGCTSGHGVCGVARLSARCIVATVVFMGTGFATSFVVRHVFA